MKIFEMDDEVTEYEKLFQLKKDCSEFLSIFKTERTPLLRGIKASVTEFYKYSTPSYRKPKDIPVELSDIIDEVFSANGFKALRRNSIFCTTSRSQAIEFGKWNPDAKTYYNIYMVFPVNGFSFTWSDKISDLYTDTADMMNHIYNTGEKDLHYYLEFFKNTVLPTYHHDNIHNALNSRNEIMIHGEYYLVDHNKFNWFYDNIFQMT